MVRLLRCALLCCALCNTAIGDTPRVDLDPVELLRQYIRIDTTNPPGNEAAAAKFLANVLDREGISHEIATTGNGRANLWARLEGGGEPGIVLLHHMDVVTAERKFWDAPPFAAALRDGYIYGRGALDMKSYGISHLISFVDLYRSGVTLSRDVLFLATADEESGSAFGMGWIAENRPEVLDGIGFGLTEGGSGTLVGGRPIFAVEVTQKVPVWLRLEATGAPGHGSTPRASNAVARLLDAVERIRAHRFEPRMIEATDRYFKSIAGQFPPKMRTAMSDMGSSIDDPRFMRNLQLTLPNLHALTQNTCTVTRLSGSEKINVVPATATAGIDCRVLPDVDVDAFVAEIEAVVNDAAITVVRELALSQHSSSTDSPLYAVIKDIAQTTYPGSVVSPSVSAGFTDSRFLRGAGITTYGFAPFLIPVADLAGFHGNNERISVENMRRGTQLSREILRRFVVAD